MLVSYARCITIATGAMLAIGAYGAAIPVVLAGAPFGAALVFATALGALAGFILAIPGVRFRSHNLAMVTLVFQSVVIIVLRESKALTGGAEGIHVPPPVISGISFANDAYFLLLCGLLCASPCCRSPFSWPELSARTCGPLRPTRTPHAPSASTFAIT